MDTYLEFIIKKKLTFLKVTAIVLLYLTATILSFAVLIISLSSPVIMQLSAFFIGGFFYGAWWINKKMLIEYEYIVTNDELDIDKIIAKKARKRLLTVSVRSFEEFGIATEEIIKAKKDSSIKVFLDASMGNNSDNRYYAIFINKQSQKMMIVFNPTSRMLDSFKIFNPRVCGQ